MSQAVEAYRGVTATEEFRSLDWLRRKTEHDEAQAIYNTKQQERALARCNCRQRRTHSKTSSKTGEQVNKLNNTKKPDKWGFTVHFVRAFSVSKNSPSQQDPKWFIA